VVFPPKYDVIIDFGDATRDAADMASHVILVCFVCCMGCSVGRAVFWESEYGGRGSLMLEGDM